MRKTVLQAFGLFGLVMFAALCLWEAFAQPIPQMRLRDLQDVKHLVPPANGNALVWNSAAGRWTNGVVGGSGGTVGLANFNSNHFSTNGGTVSFDFNAGYTVLRNSFTTNTTGATPPALPTHTSPLFPVSVLNPNGSGADRAFHYTPGFSLTGSNATLPGLLSLNGRTNLLSISATNTLLLDGVPIVAGGAGITNNIINATTINVTTQNVSVLKGGHLTISNSITILTNGVFTLQNLPWPSVLLVGPDGAATNATLSGLSLVGTTLTAAGSASVWSPVTTLAFVTTNVTIPLNGGTNFVVTLTNGNPGYFNSSGAPASATTNASWTLTVVQDPTGLRVMNWDTNVFKFQGGYMTPCTTNANAIDVFTMMSSPVTAGKVFVTWQPDFR